MRTRTLVLLAAACGVLILVAGVVQLLRIAGADDPDANILSLGDTAELDALRVTVDDVTADDNGRVVVTVSMTYADDGVTTVDGGVDAEEHFRLLAGELRPPLEGVDGGCASLTVGTQTCELVFPVADAPAGARVLVLEWAGATARWDVV